MCLLLLYSLENSQSSKKHDITRKVEILPDRNESGTCHIFTCMIAPKALREDRKCAKKMFVGTPNDYTIGVRHDTFYITFVNDKSSFEGHVLFRMNTCYI